MKHWMRIAFIPTILVLAACSHPHEDNARSAVSSSSPAPSASTELTRLLQPQSIGTTKEFLERKIGPSVSETETSAEYVVDGCHVTLGLDGRTVRSVGVLLEKGCRADIAGFVGQSGSVPVDDTLTFAQFEKLAGTAEYHSPCIDMCGNAMDPYVDAIIPGYHANGFNDLVARTAFVDDAATNASMKWAEQLKSATSEDFVINAQFNCDSSHDDIPRKLFADIKVHEIVFGSGLDDSSCP